MPFRFVGYNKVVDTSTPDATKQTITDLVQWTGYEFQGVATAMQSTESVKTWTSAPPKPRAGTQAYADGVNWNPGAGEGFYEYTSAGWVPMFGSAGWYSPWTAYTPSITSNAGAYTAATTSGRYKQIGKVCHVNISIVLTTVGSGTYPIVGLPVQAASFMYQNISGREINSTGFLWQGQINPSATTAVVLRYDNGVAVANGYNITLSGAYETV